MSTKALIRDCHFYNVTLPNTMTPMFPYSTNLKWKFLNLLLKCHQSSVGPSISVDSHYDATNGRTKHD